MVDKHSIFSFDPFPRKETPAIFKINGTMILLKVGIGFQVKIVLLLKISDFRAGWCVPPPINPFETAGNRMLPEFPSR